MASAKYDQLQSLIRSYGSCLVAYSGGVDSVLLAHSAYKVLGAKALAVIADSPSLPRAELAEALEIAARFAFPVRVIQTREFENPQYLANPVNRCYFCKSELFNRLSPIAKSEGFQVIAYGENASDGADFRPGAIAAAESNIRAPLREAQLTKKEIRQLSAELGLPTSEKPQLACLSSRIPHGEMVSPDKLKQIEEAEKYLRELGFHEVRVRHHSLPSGAGAKLVSGSLSAALASSMARIEVGAADIARMADPAIRQKVVGVFQKLGYRHVALDLAGYNRPGGS